MGDPPKLLCVSAHPDDESLGFGGTLARYAQAGVQTYLLTATRGERGRYFDTEQKPGLEVVGRTREAELREAAEILGVRETILLGYVDGDLDQADPATIQHEIADHIRRVRPQVVLSFGPDGAYGHPDHIAISQFTTGAIVLAGDSSVDTESGLPAHRVSKFYFLAWGRKKWDAYQAAFKKLTSRVDGVERVVMPWADWQITTKLETASVWETVWRAVQRHKTQMSIYESLGALSEEYQRELWGSQEFYRVFSAVNGGRSVETDLFEGLREKAQ